MGQQHALSRSYILLKVHIPAGMPIDTAKQFILHQTMLSFIRVYSSVFDILLYIYHSTNNKIILSLKRPIFVLDVLNFVVTNDKFISFFLLQNLPVSCIQLNIKKLFNEDDLCTSFTAGCYFV